MNSTGFQEVLPLRGLKSAIPDRAARLPACLGMPQDAQAILSGLKAMFVGTGSVGSMSALHFARLQPRAMYLADRGTFKPESLQTHAWIQPENAGKPKANLVGHLCRKISPETEVYAFDGEVQSLPASAFAEVDCVFLATDNLTAEVFVDQMCLRWGIPLIHSAVHGETLIAQTRFLSHADEDGPCLRCHFTPDEERALEEELVFFCTGVFDEQSRGRAKAVPTMSTSFLCSLAAELAVTQVFRHVLGLGRSDADRAVEYCGYTHRTVVSPLARNPACRADHQAWRPMALPRPKLAECTLAQLAEAAGHRNGLPLSFAIGDDLHFANEVMCACGHRERHERFTRSQRGLGQCPRCGAGMYVKDFLRPTTDRDIASVSDKPLGLLGAADAGWALVYCGGAAVAFRDPFRSGEQPCNH